MTNVSKSRANICTHVENQKHLKLSRHTNGFSNMFVPFPWAIGK